MYFLKWTSKQNQLIYWVRYIAQLAFYDAISQQKIEKTIQTNSLRLLWWDVNVDLSEMLSDSFICTVRIIGHGRRTFIYLPTEALPAY